MGPIAGKFRGGPVPHAGMGPMASFEMSAANTILLVRIPKQGMEEIVTNWTTPSVQRQYNSSIRCCQICLGNSSCPPELFTLCRIVSLVLSWFPLACNFGLNVVSLPKWYRSVWWWLKTNKTSFQFFHWDKRSNFRTSVVQVQPNQLLY